MKLFVSYSRDEKFIVNELSNKLRTEGQHDVWIDKRLVGADEWWNTILENIEQSDCFVAIVTSAYLKSIFCMAELEYALSLQKPILPILLKPTPIPNNLQAIQYIDVQNFTLMETLYYCDKALSRIELRLKTMDSTERKNQPARPARPQDQYEREIVTPLRQERTEITCGQFIYTRVEGKYSPQRATGYQVLYHSSSISEAQQKIIAQFITRTNLLLGVARFQFFKIDVEYFGIAFSVGIESDPDLVDRNGRSGVFLTHCLVLNISDFGKAENNPFNILDNFVFLKSTDDLRKMISQYGTRQDISPATIILKEISNIRLNKVWITSGLANFQKVVNFYRDDAAENGCIAVYGDASATIDFVRELFEKVPLSERPYSTFDTNIVDCPPPDKKIWLVGNPSTRFELPIAYKIWLDVSKGEIHYHEVPKAKSALSELSLKSDTPPLAMPNSPQPQQHDSRKNPFFRLIAMLHRKPSITPITCPYCLSRVAVAGFSDRCSVCGSVIPSQYIDEFSSTAPFFVQVMGWTATGKTVYQQALTSVFLKMSRVWDGYSCIPATEGTSRRIQEIRQGLINGEFPSATPMGPQDAYVMLLKNIPYWGNRALVIRDSPGELFDTMNIPIEHLPYLLHAPTTLMCFSLSEFNPDNDRSLDFLLNHYLNTLLMHNISLRKEKRSVVVVLTKADRISNLPANLREYLISDPLWQGINAAQSSVFFGREEMIRYLETMKVVSDKIEQWLIDLDPSFSNFANRAKDRNINVRYSLISSLGYTLSEDEWRGRLNPRRVLDPYFWALENQK